MIQSREAVFSVLSIFSFFYRNCSLTVVAWTKRWREISLLWLPRNGRTHSSSSPSITSGQDHRSSKIKSIQQIFALILIPILILCIQTASETDHDVQFGAQTPQRRTLASQQRASEVATIEETTREGGGFAGSGDGVFGHLEIHGRPSVATPARRQ